MVQKGGVGVEGKAQDMRGDECFLYLLMLRPAARRRRLQVFRKPGSILIIELSSTLPLRNRG